MIKKSSLSEEVYNRLLERLLENQLVPGIILNRREVAAELGMSVAPVLEAMLQLEMEGFLESIPRIGTQVRPVTAEDVREQLIVREALECQAARLYCGDPVKRNEEQLMELAGQVDATAPNTVEHWRAELEFHNSLMALTGVQALKREYRRVMRLNVFFGVNRIVTDLDVRDVRDHRELVRMLKTTDPDEAERIMREHARSGKTDSVLKGLR